jgi:hypothetical protein
MEERLQQGAVLVVVPVRHLAKGSVMSSPHMLEGEEIRANIQACKAEVAKAKTGMDRQLWMMLLCQWQIAAELDEIRYSLRKAVQDGIPAASTR